MKDSRNISGEAFMNMLEKEIDDQQRNVAFDIKEYTIEIIVQKYLNGLEKDENEFFVPEYQREFVWDENRQSRFIESLMIGLPIPYRRCSSFYREIKGRL